VFQCDRRNRYADPLRGRNYLGLELLAVALPTTTLRECFRFDSVHVSAYSLGGHDTPKRRSEIQDGFAGRLRRASLEPASIDLQLEVTSYL